MFNPEPFVPVVKYQKWCRCPELGSGLEAKLHVLARWHKQEFKG